ncbi:MAG: hypothetical protein M3459_11225 [Actinomycetota bacterium]|nr:hypothetical protein [Actinomycetota bacterium]
MAEHCAGQVRPPEGQPGPTALVQLVAGQRETQLLQAVGHGQHAALAIGAQVGQRGDQVRRLVVDRVGNHVQLLVSAVDSGELHGGHHAHALAPPAGQRLPDPIHRVVVGQREHLDPGRGGAGDHLGGLQRAVGARRVRLAVEGGRHGL